jgi:hypothetical protein
MRTAPQILIKAESESYLANFDWTDVVATGETVSSATVTAVPTTLTIGSPGLSDAIVQVRLSGGTGDDVYELKCVAVTSLGNTLTGVGLLIVEDSD